MINTPITVCDQLYQRQQKDQAEPGQFIKLPDIFLTDFSRSEPNKKSIIRYFKTHIYNKLF